MLDQTFGKMDDLTWEEFKLIMVEEGWTAERLKRSYRYILKEKYKWIPKGETSPLPVTINDFYRVPTPKLYPYAWFQERVNENKIHSDMIACYALPDGGKGWGWISEVGDMLPVYEPKPEAPKLLEEKREPLSDDVKSFVEVTQENLALRTELSAVNKELAEAIRYSGQGWDLVADLNGIIVDLLEDTITLDELRGRFEERPKDEEDSRELNLNGS